MLVISVCSCCYLALEQARMLEREYNLSNEMFVLESRKGLGFIVYTQLSQEEFRKATGMEIKMDLSNYLEAQEIK